MKRVIGISIKYKEYRRMLKDHSSTGKLFGGAMYKPDAKLGLTNVWLKKDTDNLEPWILLLRNMRQNEIKFEIVDIKIYKQLNLKFDE